MSPESWVLGRGEKANAGHVLSHTFSQHCLSRPQSELSAEVERQVCAGCLLLSSPVQRRQKFLRLCLYALFLLLLRSELRGVAVPLVDAFGIPDHVLRAPIGLSSGAHDPYGEYLHAVGFDN